MTSSIHLSFKAEEWKEIQELHERAIAEGKRGSRSIASELYAKALREYYGITKISTEEAKRKITYLEEQEKLLQAEKDSLKSFVAESEKLEQDRVQKELKEKQKQEEKESRRLAQLEERRKREHEEAERQKQAELDKKAQLESIYQTIKTCTNFKDKFAWKVATDYVEKYLPTHVSLISLLRNTAHASGYEFYEDKLTQEASP